MHRFLTTTMQTAIIKITTAVVLTREAIVIEDATDGIVEDVTFKDDDGAFGADTDAVVGDITDDERNMEGDADRMVEETDGVADDEVMEESTDWDDTVKEG